MRLQTITNPQRGMLWYTLLLVSLSVAACSVADFTLIQLAGQASPEAETLFHQDPRWLGADAALSVPLGSDRMVWLFGDSFIATSDAHVRTESELVRNTIALQTGTNPLTAPVTFHWRQNSDGSPTSFFPENGQYWYWPGHGIRLIEGPLVIFLSKMVATADQGLGFRTEGYAIAVMDNPDASPKLWNLHIVDSPPLPFDAIPATAVVQDGAHIVAVAIRQEGTHAGALVRYSMAQLAQGDIASAEWWAGTERGWVREAALWTEGPTFVLDDAGAECSLHWDERSGSFIHIASYGFGASTIGMRSAPAITGPWSSPVIVYLPPESDEPHPFVYAAKAHPELAGPNAFDLVITYVPSSLTFRELFTPQGELSRYWPRFALVPIGK